MTFRDPRRLEHIREALMPACAQHAAAHGCEHAITVTQRGIELSGQHEGQRHTDVLVTMAELDEGRYVPFIAQRAHDIFTRAGGALKEKPADAAAVAAAKEKS